MSVIININGPVNSLVVNTSEQGTAITANGDQVWPEAPVCLTFSSPNAFSSEAQIISDTGLPIWDGAMEYSTDAETWTTWDASEISAADNSGTYYLYIRGTGNTRVTGNMLRSWVITGSDVSCAGDLRSLLNYSDFTQITYSNSCFAGLFRANASLVSCPGFPDVDVGSGNAVFAYLYGSCTNLETLPQIPIANLKTTEFVSCFNGCSKIKVSETQEGEYQTPYRIPTSGTGTDAAGNAVNGMFVSTGGTFTGTPSINTTYYTSNRLV